MSWRKDAKCTEADPEAFFPDVGESADPATRICRRLCPVRRQCLNEALTMESRPSGVWGGYSERELHRMRSKRADRLRAD